MTTPVAAPPADASIPSTPAGLAGNVRSADEIDLSWTPSTDTVAVAGYKVSRDGTLIATVGGTSWIDTSVAAGTTYTYTVTALDAAANESAKSPTWSGAAASGAITTTYAYDTENHLTALQTGSTVLGTYVNGMCRPPARATAAAAAGIRRRRLSIRPRLPRRVAP